MPAFVRPRLCSAPLREELRAALRPGNGEFSFIYIKSRGFLIHLPPNLAYHARVLSSEGALLEAILKWDRARAGRAGATRIGRCGARGCVSHTQTRGALGSRPGPLRGSAFSGWTGQVKGGRKPARMASLLAPVPEV